MAIDLEMTVVLGTPETLILQIGLTDAAAANTGVGSYVLTDYYLVPATASYDVEVQNGIINLASMPAYPDIIARANNTDNPVDMGRLLRQGVHNASSTLGGLAFAGMEQFFALASVEPGSNMTGGTPALMQLGNPVVVLQHQLNYKQFFDGTAPGPLFADPKDYIIGWLNQLMFRAGVWAAQTYSDDDLNGLMDDGLSSHSTVTGTRMDAQSVYRSNYWYFGGVAALEILTVLVVLALFRGSWCMERGVSMSPLEIARLVCAVLHSARYC